MHKVKNLVMTMYSSKGLEFDVVIVFAENLINYGKYDENGQYLNDLFLHLGIEQKSKLRKMI